MKSPKLPLTKAFIEELAEKYPNVKSYMDIHILNILKIRKVISDEYKYEPQDKELKTVHDKNVIMYLNSNIKSSSVDGLLRNIKSALVIKLDDDYNIKNVKDITCIEFLFHNGKPCIKFDYSRTETEYEYTERMIKDAEEKALYDISQTIIDFYNYKQELHINKYKEEERRKLEKKLKELN